jgi:hypothetical protein
MKKLLRALFSLAVSVLLINAAAYLGGIFLAPRPAEFQFAAPTEEIVELDIISITRLDGNLLELKLISEVEDKEAFLSELFELECATGVSVEAIGAISSFTSLRAIMATYSDGRYEIITAYGNLDSDALCEDAGLDMLIGRDYYFFEPQRFDALTEKYSHE